MIEPTTNPLTVLRALDAFFDSSEKWAQNAPAKNSEGHVVHCSSPYAVRWCMIGILNRWRTRPFLVTMITQATQVLWPKNKKEGMGIIDFNDSRSGFEDFKAGLQMMIAYWEAQR